jgi:cytochrome c biogenesis protein CcmG, thiol:disulfide interchange protein DsbE
MKIYLSFLIIFLSFSHFFAQNEIENNESITKKLPSVKLKDYKGKVVNTAELGLKGPIIFSFWATWCAPCKKELNAINDLYSDWQAETGVTLVAVSIDDEKTKSRVAIDVDGKAWEYIVLLDPNGDFKRAMGVNNVPHTFLVDTDGTIVYSHNNYAPGDEEKLYEEIKKLSLK